MSYREKYIKYKNKYLNLKQIAGMEQEPDPPLPPLPPLPPPLPPLPLPLALPLPPLPLPPLPLPPLPPQIFLHDFDVEVILRYPIRLPFGLAINIFGNIIVSDYEQNRIHITVPNDNAITIGSVYGYHDGPAIEAQFAEQEGIAVMANGTIIVADAGNNRIRAISLEHVVSTIAGTGAPGFIDGPTMNAQFRHPQGVAVMPDQTIIIVDTYNYCIRAISPGGNVRTIAGTGIQGFNDGNGTVAQFSNPSGVTCMPNGTIIIADTQNHRIRFLRPIRILNAHDPNDVLTAMDYMVGTVAGTGISGLQDGPGALAQFSFPRGVAARGNNIIVADTENCCIREINEDYSVSSLAGNGNFGTQYGPGEDTNFSTVHAVAIMPDNTIIVADTGNNSICALLDPTPPAPPAKKK
jgi:hypothetical protein